MCPGSDQNICTDKPSQSRTRLYVGLEAIHVDSAVFFALLQVPRGNWRLLPICLRSDALLQLHEPGHLGGDELRFNSRWRGPIVAVVAVTVHHKWGADGGFVFTDQGHLDGHRITGMEAGRGRKEWLTDQMFFILFPRIGLLAVWVKI